MNLVSILVAPFAIREFSWGMRGIVIITCLVLLGIAVAFSKRGSLAKHAVEHPELLTESAGEKV